MNIPTNTESCVKSPPPHARKLYRQLDGNVKGLRQLPSEPTKRLKQLKEWLTELSQTAFDYVNHLRDLELHRTTIETNKTNYQFWLNQLKVISLEKEDNLECRDTR